MRPSPPPSRIGARQAGLISAGVVLLAAGLYLPNGWPLTLGGFALLIAALAAAAER
jgi:phytoene dehydrogenase-like protein